ncbi:outer membrane beta-barrel protein [bacterium]|nr:outer membrane beta-barrel protein [bacterium]
MKNKNLFVMGILFLCFGLSTIDVGAQGFASILEKLDKLEQRLNQLEALEKRDINRLRNQINAIKPVKNSGADAEILTAMQIKVEDLVVKVNEIKKASKADLGANEVQGLISDLKDLTGELRRNIETAINPPVKDDELKVSGFVDASYFFDHASNKNSFGLDQVEIDFEKLFGGKGSIRADLEWVSDGAGGMALEAEQGYVKYGCMTFGKFNAPIGFELLDAPDMFQFSHALVFNFGLPTNLTGIMFNHDFNNGLDIALHLSNGWDQNVDINKGKTFGGRVGYAFGGDKGGLGLSLIRGAQNGPEGEYLTVLDVDLTFNPVPALTIGGEFNKGSDYVAGLTVDWIGFLLMTHYDFTEKTGLTFRYDFFDDIDGARLGSGVAEKRQALTFAPTFSLGDGMAALFEFRIDFSDQEVFTDKDGSPSKSSAGAAFEMIYLF